MSKTKLSRAEQIRQRMLEKAQKDSEGSGGNGIEWTPKKDGKYLIRILPPVGKGENIYATHSYHYLTQINDGKGRYIFSKRTYPEGRCPIDEQASEMFDLAKETKDKNLKNEASEIKRKARYYFNILLLEENGIEVPVEKQRRILVDTTNPGSLTKQICRTFGIPFYRDFESGWVEEDTLQYDEDEVHYDLIDEVEGHDFKINRTSTVKITENGKKITIPDFSTSIAVKKPRPLSKEQLELMKECEDLDNYVKYENYETVKGLLNSYLEIKYGAESEGAQSESSDSKPTKQNAVEEVDDEAALMAALEED